MTPTDLFPINPKLSLLPPGSLARINEFPDLIKVVEDAATNGCPGRPVIRLIIRLCRLSGLASTVWLCCFTSAALGVICAFVAFLGSRGIGGFDTARSQLFAAGSFAAYIVFHTVYASVRKFAYDIAEEVEDGKANEQRFRPGTNAKIVVP